MNLAGCRFETTRKLDFRNTGGPLIPKGTKGNIEKQWELLVWVDIDGFGHRHLLPGDVKVIQGEQGQIVNKLVLRQGGATSPNVEFYQFPWSGHCRLYWFCHDQDGKTEETIATFRCKDWNKAKERARTEYASFRQDMEILCLRSPKEVRQGSLGATPIRP